MGGQPRRSRDEPTAVAAREVVARPPSRVIIEDVTPQVDGGRFAAKRAVGEAVDVGATIFAEGHDLLSARIRWRRAGEPGWHDAPMDALGNDAWTARFVVETLGRYEFTVEAWIDRFGSWRHGFARKVDAGQDVASELLEGAALVRAAATRAGGTDGTWLGERADVLGGAAAQPTRVDAALAAELHATMARHPDRDGAAVLAQPLAVEVEVERAAFGAWYECFPRSMSPDPSRAGTLRDLADRLDYVAGMGFDVLYLPPIHPIGTSYRKGRDNTLVPEPGDPGSPWAIGSSRRRPHRRASRSRHPRRLRRAGRARARARPRGRARHRVPVLARPSMGPRAPRVVPAPARRLDPVRGEPPETLPGHLPVRLRVRGLGIAVGRAARRRPLLGRARRDDLPRRQPAHQAVRVLGVADRRGARATSRGRLSRRSVHAAGGHAPPGQGGLLAVVHLLHLAQHEDGAGRVPDRAHADARPRVHAAELLREHAGHPARVPADRRPRGVPDPAHPRGHDGGKLRHLRAALRAVRGRRGARHGGVPRLGEVRGAALGPRRPRRAPAADHAAQSHPPRQRGVPARPPAALLPRGQRRPHRLRQDDARSLERPHRRREPRPAPSAVGISRAAAARARHRPGAVVSGRRPARRRALSLAGAPQLRRARPARAARRTSFACGGASAPSRTSTTSYDRPLLQRPPQARGRHHRQRRPALVQGRRHLRAARQRLPRQRRRRHRRLPRPHAATRLPARARRHRALAAAVLPLAAARRRLRHRRLPAACIPTSARSRTSARSCAKPIAAGCA